MPTAGTTHHIVLNGVGYMLRVDRDGLRYKRSEVPFSVPRRADTFGRQGLTRPGQDNDGFASGVLGDFGEGGYARGHGVDARTGDGARISAKLESVSSGAVQLSDMADFNGTVYATGLTGAALMVYKYSSGGNSFSELSGTGVNPDRLVAFGNVLWVVQGPSNIAFRVTTGDAANQASGANAGTPLSLGRSGLYMLALDGPGSTRFLRWATLYGGAPVTVAWTQQAESGDSQEEARTAIVSLDDDFYLCKDDGLYRVVISADGTTATMARVVDFGLSDSVNGAAIVTFAGKVYYRVRERLKAWNGSSESDVTPPPTLSGSGGPATVRHAVQALAASARWLFAVTKSDESTPALELWAFDGDRWEHLHQIASASGVAAGALWASASVNRLLINYYTGAAWATLKMDLRSDSDLPSAVFNTTGNFLYLAAVDGGLPDVVKRWHSVAIRGELDGTNQVDVEYWDGNSWELVSTLSAEGEAAFGSTVTGKSLWLRLELKGAAATTPVVREVGVNFDYLPGPLRTIEFEAVLGPNVKGLDGVAEANSAATLLAALDTARAAGTVVTLVDPVVTSYSVRLTKVEVRPVRLVPESAVYGWYAAVEAEVVG
jgi:hypothetical protein